MKHDIPNVCQYGESSFVPSVNLIASCLQLILRGCFTSN